MMKTLKMLFTFLALLLSLLILGCAQHSSSDDMGQTMNTMEQTMDGATATSNDQMMNAPMQDSNDKGMDAMDTMKSDPGQTMMDGADDGKMMK